MKLAIIGCGEVHTTILTVACFRQSKASILFHAPPPSPSNFPPGEKRNRKPNQRARKCEKTEMAASSDEFSVVVLASDLGIDARPFLSHQEGEEEQENWHDCSQYLSPDEDFSDLDLLQFFRLQGSDKHGNRIYRIVGKYFPGKQTDQHLSRLLLRLDFLKSFGFFCTILNYYWLSLVIFIILSYLEIGFGSF